MIKKMRLGDKGVTLIELIVSIAITSIIIAGVTQLVMYGMRQYNYKNLEHQQYLLLDHVRDVISQELRYAKEVIITDDDSATFAQDYTRVYGDSTGLVSANHGVEKILCNASLYGSRTVRLEFDADRESDITRASASTVFVTVYIDEGKDWEMVEEFTVKALNVPEGERVEVASGASGEVIGYR